MKNNTATGAIHEIYPAVFFSDILVIGKLSMFYKRDKILAINKPANDEERLSWVQSILKQHRSCLSPD